MAFSSAIIAGVGTANSIYSGEKARTAQNTANDEAKRAAEKLAADTAASEAAATSKADEALGAATAKKPNLRTLLGANQAAAKGGISGTTLTGPAGVDPSSLQLGKNTLLGS